MIENALCQETIQNGLNEKMKDMREEKPELMWNKSNITKGQRSIDRVVQTRMQGKI